MLCLEPLPNDPRHAGFHMVSPSFTKVLSNYNFWDMILTKLSLEHFVWSLCFFLVWEILSTCKASFDRILITFHCRCSKYHTMDAMERHFLIVIEP